MNSRLTAAGLQGLGHTRELNSTWQDRTEGTTGFAELPTSFWLVSWHKPTSSFPPCRGGISFAFSHFCEAPCCTSNALQSRPQGFPTCPVLCPAAQAHLQGLVLPRLGSHLCECLLDPSPCSCSKVLPMETVTEIKLLRSTDAPGYLGEHPHCPWVAPAKQLGLEQDLTTFCLELQSKCIIPNSHQAPSLGLARDHYYKK